MNESHRQRRMADPSCDAKEIFELTPVMLGGSPTDPANKVVMTRVEHIDAVKYWNRIIQRLREEGGRPKTR